MNIVNRLTAPYYTRQNLEVAFGSKRRTLDYRISKLILDGVLERIKPGFYLNKRLLYGSKRKDQLLEYVGSKIKYPSYVSLEYVLSKYEVIPESIYTITYITLKKPSSYSSNSTSFRYRNIRRELFTGYKKYEFDGKSYLFAEKYKALFDFIYLTPLRTSYDFEQLLFQSRINWDSLSREDKNSFINMCDYSRSKKMARVVKMLTNKEIL